MDLHLEHHRVLITGGASGIGWAIARGFAAEGVAVALWDVSEIVEQRATELAQEFHVPVVPVRVDMTQENAVRDAHAMTVERLGVPDHVVHSAAIGSGKSGFPFTNLHPSDWKRVLDVNILGMVHLAHAVAPDMVTRGSGSFVFIASVAGQMGSQTDPPYSASKAANINFAQCLAKDLAPHGIRVNTLCPGMVQTPLNRGVWQSWNAQQTPENQRSYEDWAGEKIRKVVPLGRWQTPENIADMAVFLSSDRASEVTGQTINVDGGFVMHW